MMKQTKSRISLSLTALLVGAALAACGGSEEDHPFHRAEIDVTKLTISEIQAGYKNRRFTSEEVTAAYLKQIATYEASYNAFTFESQKALEEAREVDRKRAAGETLGPLAGVPIVVKESIDVVGYPSTAGWAKMSSKTGGVDLFPVKNAVVVKRLLDAGAIILGKTNIPTYADDNTRANSSWAGPTYNTIDRDIVPGASSSGTATAVGAGFAPAGLATETGGSIQNPASAQSLVGIKPTFGLVPASGVVPLAGSTRDVIGAIAGNVKDAAIMLTVLAGYSVEDPKTAASNGHIPSKGYAADLSKTSLQGKRIGLYGRGWRSEDLSPETKVMYDKAIKELEERGAVVVPDPFAGSGFAQLALPDQLYDFRGTESAAYDLQNYYKGVGVDSLAALKQKIGVSPFDEVGGPLHWYVELLPVLKASLANPALAPDLSEYTTLKANYLRIFNKVLNDNRIDAMVFPHTTHPLPKLSSTVFINETTVSALNISGLPGVAVPAGKYGNNNGPFALVFVGRQWSEPLLINLAYDYEQATQHRLKANLVK